MKNFSLNLKHDVVVSDVCLGCSFYKDFLASHGGKKKHCFKVFQAANDLQHLTGNPTQIFRCGLMFDNGFGHLCDPRDPDVSRYAASVFPGGLCAMDPRNDDEMPEFCGLR